MASAKTTTTGMSNLLKVGLAGAAVAAGYALYKMARTGLESMVELDNAMKTFQTETGASAEETEKMREVTRKLYRQNTDSYEELGAALTEVRQRFGDLGDEMEDRTQDFLDFAKVTGQDTPKAIEDMNAILKGFNRGLEDADELMDGLLAVSQETGASLPKLQKALAEASPAMEALGVSTEEGIAMLGHFETRGVSADTAVRGLRNAMQRLEEPTKQQLEAIETLGIGYEELADGTIKVADDAFPQLIERLSEGNLSAEETTAALEILGRRAGTDMVRGLKDGKVGMEELMAVIKESEGTVSEASSTYDKQLGERWELIRRKYLAPFMEWIGDKLLTVLENVAAFIETWGPRVIKVFEMIGNAINKVRDAIDAIKGKTQELYEGGKNTITSWGAGIKEGAADAVEATKNLASKIGNFLIGHSPPVEGPLSEIDVGGRRLIEAWAAGMLSAEGYLKNVIGHLSQTSVNGLTGGMPGLGTMPDGDYLQNTIGHLSQVGNEIENANEQVLELQTGYDNWFSVLENGLNAAITGTKDLSDVLKDIGRQLANKMLQTLLFGKSGDDSSGGLFGAIFGNLFHTGGIVGKEGVKAKLPRYHSGGLVGSNEQLAVLQKGEGVFTPEQMKSMGGENVAITMNINAVDSKSFVEMMSNNRAVVESIIIDNVRRNGQIRRAIRGAV